MEAAGAATKPSRSDIRLSPVEVPKASDVLAGELRERILNGELAEGAPLPAERELVKQTQMSRATVREALRILEVQNLVRVKAGRAGGAFVQRPTTKSMAKMPLSRTWASSTMRLVSSICASVGISAARFFSAQP